MGLVAEVSAGLDQCLHGDDRSRHSHFLSGCSSGRQMTARAERPARGTGICTFHANLLQKWRNAAVEAWAPLAGGAREIQPRIVQSGKIPNDASAKALDSSEHVGNKSKEQKSNKRIGKRTPPC
jgi:hypothetical protein